MTRLAATPFAPGQARGPLRRGGAGGGIRLVHQEAVAGLVGAPDGLIVVGAAPFSHAMIRLLGLGVPVVLLGAREAAALPEAGEVFIDGERGFVAFPADADPAPPPPPRRGVATADGVTLRLRASVAGAAGARRAREAGAEAIGLVRTEYLIPPDGAAPDAAYYAAAFVALGEAARPLPVTLRLLDIAADKRPAWVERELGPGGPLGLQGARLYDTGPVREAFEAQLSAVDRVSGRFPLRLLIPYLTAPEEFRRWRDVVARHLPGAVPIGAMVETPALALMLDRLLAVAEFAALGLNDLMQCLFAADRDRAELAAWLDPHAPALYRFLDTVARSAGEGVGQVQLCGLLPQLPGVLPVLLGLGFRVFSVEPHLVPYLARRAAGIRLDEAAALAWRVCAAPDAAAVRGLLRPDAA